MTQSDLLFIVLALIFPLYMWTVMFVLDKSWPFFNTFLSRWIN